MSIFITSDFSNVMHSIASVASNLGNVLEHFTPELKEAQNLELNFVNFLMQHLEAHRKTLLSTPAVAPVQPVVEPITPVDAPIEATATEQV